MLNIYDLKDETFYNDGSVLLNNPKKFSKCNSINDISLCLINSLDAFDLINEVGRTILDYVLSKSSSNNAINLYDIIDNIIFDNGSVCFKNYDKWIEENAYPYSYRKYCEGNTIGRFLYDSVFLTIYNELHIWTLKFNDGYGVSSRFYKLLNLLDMPNNVLYNFCISPEDLAKATPNPDNNIDENAPLFHNLKNLLLNLISKKANDYEYIITKQTPYYNKDKDNYHLYSKANSIMGIAYYQLLLNITSINYRYMKICRNPECINFINVEKNYRYCDACRDNKIPQMLKNRRYNNSDKGKKQRHKHYIIKKEKEKR